MAELQQIGNELSGSFTEAELNNVNDLSGSHQVVCAIPVNFVKGLRIATGGGRVKDQMLLNEDAQGVLDMARRELSVRDEGLEIDTTP